MSNTILDENVFGTEGIKSKEDIKKLLSKIGLTSYYEDKKGLIILEQSDAVQVSIQYLNGKAVVKQKFPQIGNSVQVLVSMVLLGLTIFVIQTPFPSPWIIAIVGGQLFSYFFYSPKTKALKEKVESLLL